MLKTLMRKCSLIAVACSLPWSAFAVAESPAHLNVPAGELVSALKALAAQSNVELVYQPEQLKDIHTEGVTGNYLPQDAVAMLLKGTALRVYTTENGAMIIAPTAPPHSQPQQRPGLPTSRVSPQSSAPKSLWQRSRLARSDTPSSENSARSSDENSADSQSIQLEAVTVTAQRREERLQDVPISVQVIGAQTLSQQNLTSLNSVSQTVPSVHVASGGRSAALYVRGVGSNENQSYDQSVGVFVDDIYHGRSRMTSQTFLDLNHLEILKGPQSTFFGNNAIAGAFNIVTQKPGDEFGGWTRALLSPRGDKNGGQYTFEGAANLPLSPAFAMRVAATYNGQDGWLENINNDRRVPKEDNKAARVTFRYTPNDDFDATLKIEGSKNRTGGGLWLQNYNCPPPAPFTVQGFCGVVLALGIPTGVDNNRFSASDGQKSFVDTYEYVLTASQALGEYTLTSVTGYYGYRYNLNLDTDGTPLTLLHVQAPEDYHQFSQELRIASPTGRTIEYLAGLYYQDGRLDVQQSFGYNFLDAAFAATPFGPYLPLGQVTNAHQKESTESIFGSLTWNATERLKVSAGLRGSRVKKDFDWELFYGTATQMYGGVVALPPAIAPFAAFLPFGTPGTVDIDRSDHAWMPSAHLQYQLHPNAMTYLSYSRGFKSGGFNTVETSAVPSRYGFGPESVDAYEAGVKSAWADGRLLLNAALFRSTYDDLQVSVNLIDPITGGFTSIVDNAAKSRSQGVEFEVQWIVSGDLKLSAVGSYLDSKYLSYEDAGPSSYQSTVLGEQVHDASGERTPYAPRWSGSLATTYALSLPANLRLTTELNGFFSSSHTRDVLDRWMRGDVRLDGRLSLQREGERWAVDLIGKNLTDRTIFVFAPGQPTAPGSLLVERQQPRNVALQLRYNW